MESETLKHTLPPVYDTRSRVLMLGSFPSPKSRATGFYYGHPQNRFWRVLAEVLGEPLPTTNESKRDMVLRHGIALWDVIAECRITGASDASIRDARPNDFTVVTSAADIRAVFTTGRTAAKLYERYTGERSVCLPSPSPANCATPFDALVAAYARALSPYIRTAV